jgi:hypothetical protein
MEEIPFIESSEIPRMPIASKSLSQDVLSTEISTFQTSHSLDSNLMNFMTQMNDLVSSIYANFNAKIDEQIAKISEQNIQISSRMDLLELKISSRNSSSRSKTSKSISPPPGFQKIASSSESEPQNLMPVIHENIDFDVSRRPEDKVPQTNSSLLNLAAVPESQPSSQDLDMYISEHLCDNQYTVTQRRNTEPIKTDPLTVANPLLTKLVKPRVCSDRIPKFPEMYDYAASLSFPRVFTGGGRFESVDIHHIFHIFDPGGSVLLDEPNYEDLPPELLPDFNSDIQFVCSSFPRSGS